MELTLITCASGISVDQQHNTLSLFNIIEDVNSPSFPMVIPSMVFVGMVTKSPDEPNEVRDLMLVASLDDERIFQGAINPVDFQGRPNARLIVNIQGLVISRPGILNLALHQPERALGIWKITVNGIGPDIRPQ